MRVQIRTPTNASAQLTIDLGIALTWDTERGEFTMLRGLADGYQPMSVATGIVPSRLNADRGGLTIEVSTPDEIERLASALDEANRFCLDSYADVRM